MSTHLTSEQMQNYLVRSISIDELGKFGDHLHGCRTCYEAYLSILQTRFPIEIDFEELAGLKGWHLEGEELANYVEGRMSGVDLDYARLHIQECSRCEERVYDSASWLENSPSTKSTNESHGASGRKYFPGLHATQSSHWQVAAALLLVVSSALILWALLNIRPEKSQVARDVPPQTLPSGNLPEQATATPSAPTSTGTDRSVQLSPQIDPAPIHDNGQVERRTDETEATLVAKGLRMPPAIEMLDRTPSIAVRGNNASIQSFTIVRPFATVISNDRPRFCWTALNGATSYTVSVYDADLHLVITSEPLNGTEWLIPDRLKAGVVYTWTVTAVKDGQEIVSPSPPARAEFNILGKSDLIRLNRRISRAVSHAARGVLYAQAGLLDEADAEFHSYLSKNPSDERARKLLQTIRSWRVQIDSLGETGGSPPIRTPRN